MRTLCFLAAVALTLSLAVAQEPPLPPASRAPALVLDPGGADAPVAALAFSPDGGTLYVGGADKQVRRFTLAGGGFAADPARLPPLRVPIGPGNAGAVNAVAVSPDGKWVAVAGRAPFRDEAYFGDPGAVTRTGLLTADQKQDVGVVYLFDTTNPAGGKVLRGVTGAVRAVAFAHPSPPTGPVLAAAGLEWAADGKLTGAVRVFDVAADKEIGALPDLPATKILPGLAAWPAGQGVRVAVAWRNQVEEKGRPKPVPGELLVWDVATKQADRFADGLFNRALAVRPGPDGTPRELWSGGFQTVGKLHVRPVANPAAGRAVEFRPAGTTYFLPEAVAVGGDTVAVLLQLSDAADGVRRAELRVLSPDGTERGRVPLTRLAAGILPAPAVSADGKWVAVGGFADHHVEVYSTATVGKAEPQRLPGAAGGYGAVAFLTGDQLWVGGAKEAPARGGLVFDLRGRKAGPPAGNPAVDAPPAAPWKWAWDAAKSQVRGPDAVLELRKGEIPDAVAFLPAGVSWAKGFGAVVAVAHTEPDSAVSLVSLFDAKTGRRLRQLSGPLQPVTALAYSGTRPLLAGVGNDSAVHVWSLRDLGTAEGTIDGLFVTPRGGAVVVESIEPGSPADGKLKPGDVIAAVGGPEGELKAVARPIEFRNEVAALPVGGSVRVGVKGAAAPVVLPVGRGLGQRGPLFTLWAEPAAQPGPRDWIGWSPSGPYDASSPAAEARIGWLSATGDAARPASFAGVGQYRKEFYRRGILGQLAETADLAAALAALPPPQKPSLEVRVTPVVVADGGELVRDPAARLDVTLRDPDEVLPLDRAVLRWRATGPDGKPGGWQQLALTGRFVSIDLAKYPWARGAHAFEAEVLETPESSAPAATARTGVAFVPQPPKLVAVRIGGKAVRPGDEVVVQEDAAAVSADVEPGPGGAVAVSLTTSAPGGDRPQKLPTKDGKAFGPLAVKLAENEVATVRVTATAEQAGDFAKHESDTAEVRVRYVPKPPPVPPPEVRLTLETPSEPPVAVGGAVVVDTPAVAFKVVVKSAKPVERIEWERDDGKGWVAGTLDPKTLTATETVKLFEADKARKVRVRARHAGGAFAADAVSVVYRPRPPVAEFTGLLPAVLGPSLIVRGNYAGAAGPFGAKVVVSGLRPGQTREFPATATPNKDPASGTWQAAVTLFPGANKLGVVTNNPWRTREPAERPEVVYRRPPAVTLVEPVSATAGGTAEVVARVLADADLAPTGLVVNGTAAPAAMKPLGGVFGLAWWEAKASGVPIAAGGVVPDEVAVAAVNADGEGGSLRGVVRKEAPPPTRVPPPAIVIRLASDRDPRQPFSTPEPQLEFGLRVTSGRRLDRLELRHTRPRAGALPVPVVLDGGEARVRLTLEPGVNVVRVEAQNAGGESAAEMSVTYVPPPVSVEIDGITEDGPGGKSVVLKDSPGGTIETAGAFLTVRGRVVWADDSDPLAADPTLEVVAVANRVVHLPVACAARAGAKNERAFTAQVFLNAADTRVQLQVRTRGRPGGLPQQGVAEVERAFRCAAPLARQRLHVLVVGVGTPEAQQEELVRKVIAAVGGKIPADRRAFDSGEFEHRAFARAVLYRPLVHIVESGHVIGLLNRVVEEVKQTAAREGSNWVNDVVLVYYQGRDLVGSDGRRRLHTSVSLGYSPAAAERFALRLEELPPTPGVRLVVLNVLDPAAAGPSVADALGAVPPHLRYAFTKPEDQAAFLVMVAQAVIAEPKVGGVIAWLRAWIDKHPSAVRATDEVPPVVKDRRIGPGEK